MVAIVGACVLGGCGGASGDGTAQTSGQAIERGEQAEEAAEAKREEAAEATKTRELLSEVEAEKGEEGVTAAETKAKHIEAAAEAKAKKREQAAQTRAKAMEAAAKEEDEAAQDEIKKEREALSKEKQKVAAKGQSGAGAEVTTTATTPSVTSTQQGGPVMGSRMRYGPRTKMVFLGSRRRTPVVGPRQRIIFLLVAFACAGLLAGCGASSKHSPKAEAEVGAETRLRRRRSRGSDRRQATGGAPQAGRSGRRAALKKKVEEARNAQAQAGTTAPKKDQEAFDERRQER